jgi:hypothetical protein
MISIGQFRQQYLYWQGWNPRQLHCWSNC